MTRTPHHATEEIGRLYRQHSERQRALDFINAELSDTATIFKKTATQLENLIAHYPAMPESALSRIDMHRILTLISQREEVRRAMV
jgi:hypothetical protein